MTQDEYNRSLKLQVIDHKADKEKAAVNQADGMTQKEQIVNSWGLQLLPNTGAYISR